MADREHSRFWVMGYGFVFSSGFAFRVRFQVRGSAFGVRGLWAYAVSAPRSALRRFTSCDLLGPSWRLAGKSTTALSLQCSSAMGRGVRRYTDLRAWQACDLYKKAVYRLCSSGPLSRDADRRR